MRWRLFQKLLLRLRRKVVGIDTLTLDDLRPQLPASLREIDDLTRRWREMPPIRKPRFFLLMFSTPGDILTSLALLAGIVAAALAVVGAYITKKESEAKELAARKVVAEAQARGDEAQARAEEARAIAAKANEGQAKANERTVALQVELEKSRLEFLKLKEPRRLTGDEIDKVKAVLKDAPKGKIIVQSTWPDMEAKAFADQLKEVLAKCGFEILPVSLQVVAMGPPGGCIGVKKRGQSMPHGAALQRALLEVGHSFPAAPLAEDARFLEDGSKRPWTLPDDVLVLFIASKL